jgi:hypothetical protein
MFDGARAGEILAAIRPFKGVMIPYGVLKDLTGWIDKDLYLILIERVTAEVVDEQGRRIGIVRGEIQDGGCKQAIPIYPRDLITSFIPGEYDEDDIVKGIEQLVDYGRICVRRQDGGYVIGVFNCMKMESSPTQVVQKRPGDWEDFFWGPVNAAKQVWNDRRHYSIKTPTFPQGSELDHYKAWIDGAMSSWTAASGVIVKDKRRAVLLKEGRLLGEGVGMSKRAAVHAAIVQVFEYLLSRSPGHVVIHGECKDVLDHLNREVCIGNAEYFSTHLEARELLGHLRGLGWQVELVRICRKPNEECRELAIRTLVDAGMPVVRGRDW